MRKHYAVRNGGVYSFDDVHMECGVLCGICTTHPNEGKLAWLDTNGFQFEGSHYIQARPIDNVRCDNSYTMWGGQLRDRLPHGARYYRERR